MTWLLIAWTGLQGAIVQEFTTKAACEAARSAEQTCIQR
jgi:hypothetical protein